MICLMLKPSQSFFVYHIQSKEKCFIEKELFKEKGVRRIEQKMKIALTTAIKKEPTTSIRKHANELKVQKKTVRTVIKQDVDPDFNPLDYTIWVILENEINATYYPLVCLRLLLRRNGIKCVENLF